jgi:hypothetical protein
VGSAARDSASEASFVDEACDDAVVSAPDADSFRRVASRFSASTATIGGPSDAMPWQEAASHIHAGNSRQ